MMNDDRFRLDRAPATEAEWRDAVDGVLKGRPFDKVLVNETRGGLDIQPLYEPTAGTSIVPADAQRIAYGWDIRQRHAGKAERVVDAMLGQAHLIRFFR